jgi:hypothetical protein
MTWLRNSKTVRPALLIERLTVASPAVIDLLVPAVWSGAVAASLALFARALKDPTALGSWLPRLVESWIQGWTASPGEDRTSGSRVS